MHTMSARSSPITSTSSATTNARIAFCSLTVATATARAGGAPPVAAAAGRALVHVVALPTGFRSLHLGAGQYRSGVPPQRSVPYGQTPRPCQFRSLPRLPGTPITAHRLSDVADSRHASAGALSGQNIASPPLYRPMSATAPACRLSRLPYVNCTTQRQEVSSPTSAPSTAMSAWRSCPTHSPVNRCRTAHSVTFPSSL